MFGVPAEDRGSLIMYGRMPEAGSNTLFGNFIVFEEPDVCCVCASDSVCLCHIHGSFNVRLKAHLFSLPASSPLIAILGFLTAFPLILSSAEKNICLYKMLYKSHFGSSRKILK